MASAKRQILEVAREADYPLTRADLVALLTASGVDHEVVMLASLLDDHEFVDVAELEHRLDDAFGMPDAFTDISALGNDTEWTPARGA